MSRSSRVRAFSVLMALLTLMTCGSARAAGETTGTVPVGDAVYGVAAEASGSAIAVGAIGSRMLITRVSSGGAVDPTFTPPSATGIARAVAVQPDGRIVVAGEDAGEMVVRRYLSTGALDRDFGSAGTVTFAARVARSVAVGPCGDIVIGGSATGSDGFERLALAKLRSTGALDTAFGPGGLRILDSYGRNSQANGVAQQADGKVVFAGQQSPGLQVVGGFVGRVNADGSPDQSFAGGTYYSDFQDASGRYSANTILNSVAIDDAGRVVAVGADVRSEGSLAVFTRLTPAGRLDTSFGQGGLLRTSSSSQGSTEPLGARGLTLLTNGRILASGTFKDSGVRSVVLWAVTSSGSLDTAVGDGGLVKTTPGTSGGDGFSLGVTPAGGIFSGGQTSEPVKATTGFVTRYAPLGTPITIGCPAPAPPPTPTPTTPTSTTPTPTPTPTPTSTTPAPAPDPVPPTPPVATPPVTTPTSPPTSPPAPPPAVARRLTAATLGQTTLAGKQGTVLTYRLSRSATVYLTLERQATGRRGAGGSCEVPRSTNRGGTRCLRYSRLSGSKRLTGRPGVNTVKVPSGISRAPLAAGRYRLRVRVVLGNTRLLGFRVTAAR